MSQPDAAQPAAQRPLLPGPVVVVLGVAGAFVIAAGLQQASSIVGPALLGVLLVVTVAPAGSWLQRRGAPGWLALLVVGALSYGILVALVASLVISIEQLVLLLPSYQAEFLALVGQGSALLERLGVTTDQLQSALAAVDPNSVVGALQSVLGSVTGVVSASVFLLTALFFLVLEAGSFGRRLDAVATTRPGLARALRGFAASTRQYMVVGTVFGLLVAVLDAAALWVIGVPLPLLWGLLAFITNYVPNIGFVLGLVPPALLALLDGGPSDAVAVVVVYCVLNVVIQSFVQPKFVGDAVGLSPALSFLSLFVWTLVVGALGAVLAIPLTLLVKALLLDTDPSREWLRPLLSDTGPASHGTPVPSLRGHRPAVGAHAAHDAPASPADERSDHRSDDDQQSGPAVAPTSGAQRRDPGHQPAG
ncbi:AI-2E family transporter [Streptomyces sp. NP160]|uniref:AI-2E family transporter n=1 Tax=Streptomyces sp. NP160 TaxID=2586637 RepID=UPI0011199B90|nr:AI-2E family transporter [Streptomyces sp. NP160]TNM70231.1 AI-2E family transporter [Streptomyces sp. NP160]